MFALPRCPMPRKSPRCRATTSSTGCRGPGRRTALRNPSAIPRPTWWSPARKASSSVSASCSTPATMRTCCCLPCGARIGDGASAAPSCTGSRTWRAPRARSGFEWNARGKIRPAEIFIASMAIMNSRSRRTCTGGSKMAFTWRSGSAKTRERAWRLALGFVLASACLVQAQRSDAQALIPDYVDKFEGRPRVFVLTDIGNEPDDQMSLVRLLVYSNEFELEGLVATTSTWQKDKVQPETIHHVIAAFAKVRTNLEKHAAGWPEAAKLDAMVSAGQPAYGMAAVGTDKLSAGAKALITAVDRQDARPLWVTVWGGANTLAQALLHVRSTRSAADLSAFLFKMRVHSISDQDDAGPWIRREFPA